VATLLSTAVFGVASGQRLQDNAAGGERGENTIERVRVATTTFQS
jgi:hypothetical protein